MEAVMIVIMYPKVKKGIKRVGKTPRLKKKENRC